MTLTSRKKSLMTQLTLGVLDSSQFTLLAVNSDYTYSERRFSFIGNPREPSKNFKDAAPIGDVVALVSGKYVHTKYNVE